MAFLLPTLSFLGCWDEPPSTETGPAPNDEPVQVATSGDGVVVAAHPLAAAAGARMLELGGNAADAAVAAAFTLAVVEPTMSGIGGRVQILLRRPGGQLYAIDGTTQAPFRYDDDTAPRASFGYAVIGIPGQVAGVLRLHAEHGRLSRQDVMMPAIEHARDGFEILPNAAERFIALREDLLQSEGARRYFLKPDGEAYGVGDVLTQTDLANTLTTIAELGAGAFYSGPIAEQIVTDMEFNEGFVTLDDLGRYRAEDGAIVSGSYRGYDLAGSDRPAGGATAIEALHILENFPVGDAANEDWASLVGQSLLLALEDRYSPLPPEEESTSLVTSKEWAAQRARLVRRPTASVTARVGDPFWLAQEHTSHLSAADRDGMVVALTQSLGPSGGSRVATPGLGFLYAATLGGYLGPMQPGARAASAMTPFIVLADDEVKLVLGAAGGVRIISAVVEVTSRVIDQGMSLADAMRTPRFFPGFGVRSESTPWEFERSSGSTWDSAAVVGLGIESRFVRRPGAFGRIHAISYDVDAGIWQGVADPGWEGAAAIPRGPTDARVRTASFH